MKVYSIFHRVTSVLCTLALLLGMCAVPVAAADTLSVTAATGTPVNQGSSGECSVYIDSMESLASLSVTVHFDPAKIKVTDLYNSVDCVMYDSAENGDNIQFSYILDGAGEAAKTRLFYFRYQVLSDAEPGAAFFDITVSEAYDNSLNSVPVTGSRCYFNIAQAQTDKKCTARVDKTAVSAIVEEEFSLSYSFSTNQIASGFATVTYDPELFEVVGVTNGGLLSNKVADVNIAMAGSVYLSFVGTEYVDQRDLMTVTFKAIKNVTDTSSISFKVSELYDIDRNPISCPGVSSTVQLAFDPNYTGDAPTMKLNAEYDSTTEQVTAVITLEALSKLGAGDFVVEFDPKVLTLAGYTKGFSPNFFTVNDREANKGIFKFSIVSLKDIVTAETVITLTFDVTYACSDQETPIGLSGSMLSDSLTNPIVLNVRGGKTTVPLRHYIGDWVIDPAPTCTETGLNVRKCTVCGTVLETGDVISANGHSPVTDAAVEPDCVNTGLTEGSHCSVCDAVLVAQNVIPANGHTEGEIVVEHAFDPDCTNAGGYENVVYCTVCDAELSREAVVVDPLGHAEVIDEAVAHTCREDGLTEGVHCSVCNEVLIAQQVVPAAHDPDENSLCRVCNKYVGTCGYEAKWELDMDGTLTIYGSGAMSAFHTVSAYQPWYSRREDVKKVVIEDGITVIGRNAFNGCTNLSEVEIPDSVRQINYRAFYNCASLTAVDIPDSVETIENGVFYDCTGLKTVHLPANLKTIGTYLFYNCGSLTDLVIPETVTAIEGNAFYNCRSLTELQLPAGVTSIGGGAFQNCSGLKEMAIPAGVTTLGSYTFADCTGLLRVELPSQLTKIGSNAFYNCYSLNGVEIPETVTEIGTYAFYDCRSLEEIRIPAGVTVLSDGLFSGCSSLTDVELPSQLTKIGSNAFYNCNTLSEVNLPDTVTEIGASAFGGCSSLTDIQIPAGVTVLSNDLFYGCTRLADVELPSQLTKIGSSVFCDCNSLAKIEIPDTVTEIGYYAFNNCRSLTSVQLPEGITSVADNLFYGCTGLTAVNIPENATRIGQYAFYGCSALTEITVPAAVTTVAYGAFQNCTGVKIVRFEGHAPAFENRVFRYVKATAYYPYPDSSWTADVMQNYSGTIQWQAYCIDEHTPVTDEAVAPDCVNTGLTEGSHCEICGEVFVAQQVIPANGHTESEIQVENRTEPDCTNAGGYENVVYCTVCDAELSRDYVVLDALGHTEVIDAAVAHTCRETGLTEGKHCSVCDAVLVAQQVVPDAHDLDENSLCRVCGKYAGVCGPNAKWEFDGKDTLNIYGTGYMTYYYNSESLPWYPYLENLKHAVVEEGITGVGGGAFYNCTQLETVQLADSVTGINGSAFYGCSSLQSVALPETLVSIGSYAFAYCTALTELHIPDRVTRIDSDAFRECSNLKTVTLPDGLTSLNSSLFWGCSSLESVDFPNGMQTIYNFAFYKCSSLTEIEIPESVTYIGDYAFEYCSNLTKISLPVGTTRIGNGLFDGCSSLTEVVIPETVTFIGYQAFLSCSSLEKVNIPEDVTEIQFDTFRGCTSLRSIEIPGTVTYIDDRAFYQSGLEEIYIPESVTQIGNSAFGGCSSLTAVELSEGLISLGSNAFSNCKNLESITVPASVTSIGYNAFAWCDQLTKIRFLGDAPALDTGIFASLNSDVWYPADNETWTADVMQNYSGNVHWKSYCTGEHIPVVDARVEPDCTNTGLTEGKHCDACDVVIVPQNVIPANGHTDGTVVVENRTEPDCTNVGGYDNVVYCTVCDEELSRDHVVLDAWGHTEGAVVVENRTEPDCTNVGGYDNAVYCTVCDAELSRDHVVLDAWGHTEVVDPAVEPTCRETGLTEGKHCSVCHAVLIAQQVIPDAHDPDENGLCRVCGRRFGICGPNAKWDLDSNGVLTIYGTGTTTGSWEEEEIPWYPYVEEVKEVVVCDGITEIGMTSFYNCSNLTSVSLPDSLKTIGYQAFQGCTALTEIEIPESVTGIATAVFYGCSNLTKVNIPKNVTSISPYTFYNCSSLTEIEIPEGVTEIPSDIFSGCSSLKSITIPENVTAIRSGAFKNCSSLKEVYIPDAVTIIEYWAFSGCTALENVRIPDGVTAIGWSAFEYCSSLKRIHIPDTVTVLESSVFSDCTALEEVNIPAAATTIESRAFYNCSSLKCITIPDTVTEVGYQAFYNCSGLEELQIPDSVTSIGFAAFYGCTNLTEIHIPENLTQLENSLFSRCSSLTSIVIPAGVTNIGSYVFGWCTQLKEVRFLGDAPAMESSAFTSVKAMVRYPAGNETWTEEVMQNYGGTLNWMPYCTEKHTEGETVVENKVEPDCVNKGGYDNVVYCTVCGEELSRETFSVDAKGHTEVTDEAVAPDCTNTGLTAGKHCSVCDEVLEEQKIIPANGHTEVIDEAVEPDCTNTGLTEGKHCSVCDEVLEEQKIVPANGHTEVIDKAVEPDCTNTGLTAGKHCSACGEVLEEQKIIPANGHTEVIDEAVEPDCINTGLTEGKHCSVCDEVLEEQKIVPANGHTEVVDEAVAPDCTNTGLTAGKHCSVCDEVLEEQKIIPANGHTEGEPVVENKTEPDCVNEGSYENVVYCTVCGEELSREAVIVDANGHSIQEVPAVEPTFETEGSITHFRCEVCGMLFADAEGTAELKPEDVILEKLVASAEIDGVLYETLTDALTAAKPTQIIRLLQDVREETVILRKGVGLDLNGFTLEADYVFAVNGATVSDNSVDNTGLLKVDANRVMISKTNSQLPVWNGEGYLFTTVKYRRKLEGYDSDSLRYAFLPRFQEGATALLEDGVEGNKVTIEVRVSWETELAHEYRNLVFNETQVQTIVGTEGAFTLTFSGFSKLDMKTGITVEALVVSETGVSRISNAYVVDVTQAK